MDGLQLRPGAFREGGMVWASLSILDIWRANSCRTVMIWFGNKFFVGCPQEQGMHSECPACTSLWGKQGQRNADRRRGPENSLTVMVTHQGDNKNHERPLGSLTFPLLTHGLSDSRCQ